MSGKAGRVLLFYLEREGSPFREFSNFYRHAQPYLFNLPDFACREGFPKTVSCEFSEKAIMATKAALMGDRAIFQEIVESTEPKACKALGRGVRNFDEELWQRHLEEVAFQVVYQKFTSEPALRRVLLSTNDAILAEAAPNDCVWGIGLGMKDPTAKDQSHWKGRNILGTALMRARDEIRVQSNQVAAEPAAGAAEDRIRRRWGATADAKLAPAAAANGASPPASSSSSSERKRPGLFDCYAVLDFEATCEENVRLKDSEVIELPLVLVDAKGAFLDEFRTYVRPEHRPRLSRFCTELTGITQGQVDGAPLWQEALVMAQSWLDEQLQRRGLERCIFVTCGDWDLKTMMPGQCKLVGQHVPARFQQWLNIKFFFNRLVPGGGAKGMVPMLEILGLDLQGRHHSGLDDCRNIARILQVLLQRGEVLESELSTSVKAARSVRQAGEPGKL